LPEGGRVARPPSGIFCKYPSVICSTGAGITPECLHLIDFCGDGLRDLGETFQAPFFTNITRKSDKTPPRCREKTIFCPGSSGMTGDH